MTDTMRVEDLTNFGKPLIEFPKKAQRQPSNAVTETRNRATSGAA